jgi:hypothetical protein
VLPYVRVQRHLHRNLLGRDAPMLDGVALVDELDGKDW